MCQITKKDATFIAIIELNYFYSEENKSGATNENNVVCKCSISMVLAWKLEQISCTYILHALWVQFACQDQHHIIKIHLKKLRWKWSSILIISLRKELKGNILSKKLQYPKKPIEKNERSFLLGGICTRGLQRVPKT